MMRIVRIWKKAARVVILSALITGCVLVAALLAETPPSTPPDPFRVPPQDLRDGPGIKGGRVVLDLPAEPQTFNPILAQDESSQAISSLIHAALFEDGGQRPTLVKEFDVSEDNTEWILHLREGVRFSDGEPFTCADVEFTFMEVLFNEEVASPKEVWRVDGELPYQVECLDEHTVRMTTPPMAEVVFRRLLSYQVILPKHKLADAVAQGTFNATWGTDTPPEQIVGLGPFRLKRYDPGQRVVLERNPYYWKVDPNGTQLPYLDEIHLQIVREDSVRVLRFINGETEMLRPRPKDVTPILNAGLWVEVAPKARTTDSMVFLFNQDVKEPALRAVFRDVDFRRAMSHAADRESMISLGQLGYAEPRCGPGIERLFWEGVQDDPSFPCYPFDPDRAEKILDELGLTDVDGDGTRNITDGFLTRPTAREALASLGVTLEKLSLESPERDRELGFIILTVGGSEPLVTDAQIYAATLESLGLDVEIAEVPLSTLIAKLRSGDYQVARFDFLSNGDPCLIAEIYVSTGRQHFWKPSDAKGLNVPEWQRRVDELFAQQKAGSGAERRAWMEEFQKLVAENVPMIFLYDINDIWAYRKELIGNFNGIGGQAILIHPEYLFRKDLSG